ncbi:MAG: phosphoribosylformylglycinamidine synthase I [Chloroflexota bacterium]
MRPKVLILHAPGTNRDREAAWAIELAGGQPEIVHIHQLHSGERRLRDYHMLLLPGGFAHADALGAGKLLALDLRLRLGDDLAAFIAAGRPVLGICNGFQALLKAGLLPGPHPLRPLSRTGPNPGTEGRGGWEARETCTLSFNASGHFECRWVTLRPNPASPCVFTRGLETLIRCPVAHGEGNFIPQDDEALAALEANGQIALRYVLEDGTPAKGAYPANPNGSVADIAGVCNPAGNVLGLMPHPEDHVIPQQHPRWTRGEGGGLGLALFGNGVRYAREL